MLKIIIGLGMGHLSLLMEGNMHFVCPTAIDLSYKQWTTKSVSPPVPWDSPKRLTWSSFDVRWCFRRRHHWRTPLQKHLRGLAASVDAMVPWLWRAAHYS